MEVLCLGSNKKKKKRKKRKIQEKNKDKIEERFAERKQKMNTLKIKC